MSFFFQEVKHKKTATEDQIEQLHCLECEACPLRKEENLNPQIEPHGDPNAKIYVLGEAPGREEDEKAEPFVGPTGKLLKGSLSRVVLKTHGMTPETSTIKDLNEITYSFIRFNNTVRTRPPRNREPTWQEMECCRPSVEADIEAVKPNIIIGVGNVPLRWMFDQDGITKWRGRLIPVKVGSHSCWFYPVFHPAGLLRQRFKGPRGKVIKSPNEKVFDRDILWVLKNHKKLPSPTIPELDEILTGIEYTEDDFELVNYWLSEIEEWPIASIDLETNGLRPYAKDGRIISISFSNGEKSYAFPLNHRESKWTDEQLEFLLARLRKIFSRNRQFIFHNASFDLEWLLFNLGNSIARKSVCHDSMAQAYVLDTRQGMLSLDFLCLQYFGFNLKAISDINIKKIEDEPLDKLLKYNALDTKYTFKLFELQQDIIELEGLEDVYKEQIRRIPTTVLTQLKGLDVDQAVVEKFNSKLEKSIEDIRTEISSLDVIKKYQNITNTEFNPASPKQVGDVLHNYLNRKEGYRGENASYTTASDVLEKIDHPLAKCVHNFRTEAKLLNSFVRGLRANGGKYLHPDGKLHPNFNTMFTATRRLSSSNPNGQNFPSRHRKEIRSQVHAPEGHLLVACDYGQIEARVIGMASEDKFLCKALWENYDIHMEWAERIAHAYPARVGGKKFLSDKQAMKNLRTDVKNQFVFPLFYGSWYKSVAADTHIPENVCRQLEQEFWELFEGVHKWQESLSQFYEEHYYLESMTGFKYHAPLDRNKLYNYPIQGTASDIVVDAMNKLSEYSTETGQEQFQAILNIHDDLTFALPEKSIDKDLEIIIDTMLGCDFDFISVPLAIEVSIGPNWYNLDDFGVFSSDNWEKIDAENKC